MQYLTRPIPVTEALPPSDEPVLFYFEACRSATIRGGWKVGFITAEKRWRSHGMTHPHVTHWLPLPAAPILEHR
jgi:hypothetical protein